MAKSWKDYFKEDIDELVSLGEQRGRQDTMVITIQNLMQNMQWSVEQAMDAMSVPQNERGIYAELVART